MGEKNFAVRRHAKLFEAGDYPDKGVEVTEDDLDKIIATHTSVPIKIEHSESIFDGALGVVEGLYRKGKELFGFMNFPDVAWDLISTTKHRSLSCGIKKDKSGLSEVSLVTNPRVADAQVFTMSEEAIIFNDDITWDAKVEDKTTEVIEMAEVTKKPEQSIEELMAIIRGARPDSDEAKHIFDANTATMDYMESVRADLKKAADQAQATTRELQRMNTDRMVDKFKREGKITPASEKFARAIFQAKPLSNATVNPDETLKFSDGEKEVAIHFAEAFSLFLESMTPSISFQEIGKLERQEASKLSASDEAFFRDKMGIDPSKVALNI